MTLTIATLRQAGFHLSINGPHLHVEPRPGPALLARLRAAKPELMAELRQTGKRVPNAAPSALRPVFTCTLAGSRPFTLLGRVGESEEQLRHDLKDQFGSLFMGLSPRGSRDR